MYLSGGRGLPCIMTLKTSEFQKARERGERGREYDSFFPLNIHKSWFHECMFWIETLGGVQTK